jgi:hypothetical protein
MLGPIYFRITVVTHTPNLSWQSQSNSLSAIAPGPVLASRCPVQILHTCRLQDGTSSSGWHTVCFPTRRPFCVSPRYHARMAEAKRMVRPEKGTLLWALRLATKKVRGWCQTDLKQPSHETSESSDEPIAGGRGKRSALFLSRTVADLALQIKAIARSGTCWADFRARLTGRACIRLSLT